MIINITVTIVVERSNNDSNQSTNPIWSLF